jgi:hypothetical protein
MRIPTYLKEAAHSESRDKGICMEEEEAGKHAFPLNNSPPDKIEICQILCMAMAPGWGYVCVCFIVLSVFLQ